MAESYILEWLDHLISVRTRSKTFVGQLADENLPPGEVQLDEELAKIKASINRQAFSCKNNEQLNLLLSQYHRSIVALHDQATIHYQENKTALNELLVAKLDDLHQFMERRFHEHLPTDRTVPTAQFNAYRKELLNKLKKVRQRYAHLPGSIMVVMDALTHYLMDKHFGSSSLRKQAYVRKLITELEQLGIGEDKEVPFDPIDRLLLKVNFNNTLYIEHLQSYLTGKLTHAQQTNEQVGLLIEYQKSFIQLCFGQSVAWDNRSPSIGTVLMKWIEGELNCLERKEELSSRLGDANRNGNAFPQPKQKIKSTLSVDQLALILRSADDAKVLISPSLNAIFKTIVPYLSTTQQEHISNDSMRSKSYSAETRDKEIVVDLLTQMIDRIEEY